MNEGLKLENQLCFPLYAAAKEVIRRYRPLLDPIGLTYTQYITMMAMWEHKRLTVKELGELLLLDSGTLTPLLKKMETKGWIRRERNDIDERKVTVSLTTSGEELHDTVAQVPVKMRQCVTLDSSEAIELHRLLHKLLQTLKD